MKHKHGEHLTACGHGDWLTDKNLCHNLQMEAAGSSEAQAQHGLTSEELKF